MKTLIVILSIVCMILSTFNGAFFFTYEEKRAASVGLALIMAVLALQQTFLSACWLHGFLLGIYIRGLAWFDAPVTLVIELFLVAALLVLSSIVVLGRKGGLR